MLVEVEAPTAPEVEVLLSLLGVLLGVLLSLLLGVAALGCEPLVALPEPD